MWAKRRVPFIEPLLRLAADALFVVDSTGPCKASNIPYSIECNFDVAAAEENVLRQNGLQLDLDITGCRPGDRIQPFLRLVSVDGRGYVGCQGHVRGERWTCYIWELGR